MSKGELLKLLEEINDGDEVDVHIEGEDFPVLAVIENEPGKSVILIGCTPINGKED